MRCYVLEAAVQISRLHELAHEPLRARAIKELEGIYYVLENIRRKIGTEFRQVWRLAKRELRTTANESDTHLPIDWQN